MLFLSYFILSFFFSFLEYLLVSSDLFLNSPSDMWEGSASLVEAYRWWTLGKIVLLIKVWFGLVLWHINHCRLFNPKSILYIYMKYLGFGLVWFYAISTIVRYLIPTLVYAY